MTIASMPADSLTTPAATPALVRAGGSRSQRFSAALFAAGAGPRVGLAEAVRAGVDALAMPAGGAGSAGPAQGRHWTAQSSREDGARGSIGNDDGSPASARGASGDTDAKSSATGAGPLTIRSLNRQLLTGGPAASAQAAAANPE